METYRKIAVNCVTMGHQGCQKTIVRYPGNVWKAEKIEHRVYGKVIIERL